MSIRQSRIRGELVSLWSIPDSWGGMCMRPPLRWPSRIPHQWLEHGLTLPPAKAGELYRE